MKAVWVGTELTGVFLESGRGWTILPLNLVAKYWARRVVNGELRKEWMGLMSVILDVGRMEKTNPQTKVPGCLEGWAVQAGSEAVRPRCCGEVLV